MQAILDAISLGGTYALAALGLGLVFGVLKLVNFAHAELITIAAYIMVITNDLPLVVSFLIAALSATALAVLTELTVYRRLRGTGPAIMLIASFGLSVGLQKSFELIISYDRTLHNIFSNPLFQNSSRLQEEYYKHLGEKENFEIKILNLRSKLDFKKNTNKQLKEKLEMYRFELDGILN